MFTRSVAPTLLMIALAWNVLGAQSATVSPGSRVRLRTGSSRLEGQLVRVAADSVSLVPVAAAAGNPGPIAIPVAQVQSLDVWRGRASQWRSGAEIGSFVGFTTASVIFAARMRHYVGVACAKSLSWDAYGWAGALPGALVGGLVGALFHQDRWERVPLGPLHPQIAFQAGDQGVGVSIQF